MRKQSKKQPIYIIDYQSMRRCDGKEYGLLRHTTTTEKIESLDEAQLYLDKTFEAHVTGFGSVEFKRIAQRYRLTFQKHD